MKNIDPTNLVFVDEMGVLLGLTRTHARSNSDSRVYDFKPFYRGAKVTVVGAISLTTVVALMTLDGSMNSEAFEVFVKYFLVPNLWEGAVVVMDNLPAHKLATIEPLIQAAGASVLNLSPYSPDFNPIELYFSKLKSALRALAERTVDALRNAIGKIYDAVTPAHCNHFFHNAGYAVGKS